MKAHPETQDQMENPEFDNIISINVGDTDGEEFDFDFDYDPNEMYWALLNEK